MSDVEQDQDHLRMIIYSEPTIPDRTKFVLGRTSDNPIPMFLEIAQRLETQQVDYIVIPCITAHCFYDKLKNAVQTPIINIIHEICNYLLLHNIHSIGIMTTDGTIESELFQNVLNCAGIRTVVPDTIYQNYVMDIIYHQIKANQEKNENR